MAKNKAQQAAIAISMKKAGKKPKGLSKAQRGMSVPNKPSRDTTNTNQPDLQWLNSLPKVEKPKNSKVMTEKEYKTKQINSLWPNRNQSMDTKVTVKKGGSVKTKRK